MVAADAKTKNEKLDILIVANSFSEKHPPSTVQNAASPNEALEESINQTLEWASRIDANFYVTLPEIDEEFLGAIRRKWDPYISLKLPTLDTCTTLGDVIRAVDKLDVVGKEFLLVERVPTLCSGDLKPYLEKFKKLRAKDKNNVMTMVCTKAPTNRFLFVFEKGTDRLVRYDPLDSKVSIKLTKKEFATGRIVRRDLRPTGIYICGREIITQFSDNFDHSSMEHQIHDILVNEEILCQNIYADVIAPSPYFDLYVERPARHVTPSEQQEHGGSRESSPGRAPQSIWPESTEVRRSKRKDKKPHSGPRQHTSSTSSKPATPAHEEKLDVMHDTTGVALQTFDDEVQESIRNSLESEEWNTDDKQRNLILEINSSKLAYNISMEDVAKHIVLSLLKQPKFGPKFEDMKKIILGWPLIWRNYYKPETCKTQILHAIEEYAAANPDWAKYAPNIVVCLYDDVGVLTDTCINDWYSELPAKHCLKNAKFDQVVEWINESSEEEEESEEEA